jgi:hypothetical protein
MRKWIPIALIALAFLWFILTNVGSSMALSAATSNPILAFVKDGARIPVQAPGRPAAEGEAQVQAGQGVLFGVAFGYVLPDGTAVTCIFRFNSLACDSGWLPERAS